MTIEWWSYESGVMAKDFLDTSVCKIIVASIAEKVQETYHNFSVMFEKNKPQDFQTNHRLATYSFDMKGAAIFFGIGK